MIQEVATPNMISKLDNDENKLSVEEASLHHAITAGKVVDGKVEPNFKSVDKAHLNIYGAKYVAYLVANSLKNSSVVKASL